MVALEAAQRQVPLQPTNLIGRHEELVELTAAFSNTRLVTLTGVGGVGKTRLALAIADRTAHAYADGAWFVELAPLADAALVSQTVAGLVSVPLAPGADQVSALVNFFRPRQTLLILDNCEHLLASCATLSDALLRQCPHVQILATSREPLGVEGELPWRVPSLAAPAEEPVSVAELRRYAAVKLFVTRLQSALPHFALTEDNAPTVARIAPGSMASHSHWNCGRSRSGGPAERHRRPPRAPLSAADECQPHSRSASPDAGRHDQLEP